VPIYRAHRRLIGPPWMFHYPDDFVKTHDRLWFSSTPFTNAPLRQSMTYFISFWSNTNKRRHHLARWARMQYFTHGHSTDPPNYTRWALTEGFSNNYSDYRPGGLFFKRRVEITVVHLRIDEINPLYDQLPLDLDI